MLFLTTCLSSALPLETQLWSNQREIMKKKSQFLRLRESRSLEYLSFSGDWVYMVMHPESTGTFHRVVKLGTRTQLTRVSNISPTPFPAIEICIKQSLSLWGCVLIKGAYCPSWHLHMHPNGNKSIEKLVNWHTNGDTMNHECRIPQIDWHKTHPNSWSLSFLCAGIHKASMLTLSYFSHRYRQSKHRGKSFWGDVTSTAFLLSTLRKDLLSGAASSNHEARSEKPSQCVPVGRKKKIKRT